MLTEINENTTVRDLVGRYPQTRLVFEKHGIDYCCGGGTCLADAARESRTDAAELIAALKAVLNGPAVARTSAEKNWFDAPLHELVDHILKVHHSYLKEALPRIGGLLRKVQHAHAHHHGKMLGELQCQLALLDEELTGHLMKEEMILFPHIVAAEASRRGGASAPAACFGSVRYPILQMEAEHGVAGDALHKMREVTAGYVLPLDSCATFRALYEEIQQLEDDLHEHIHLENNILFPRAIAAESTSPGNSPLSCTAAPA
jgi:regulator of cell morphogenesis and NO signaling